MERVCFDNLSKEKEKKGESNAVQGLERNEALIKSLLPLIASEEKEGVSIEKYLFERLGIDASLLSEDKKN